MKYEDLTKEEKADLIYRLKEKPGHITASEKRMLAELIETLTEILKEEKNE